MGTGWREKGLTEVFHSLDSPPGQSGRVASASVWPWGRVGSLSPSPIPRSFIICLISASSYESVHIEGKQGNSPGS